MPSSATERRARLAVLLVVALTLACNASVPESARYHALVVNETGAPLCALQLREAGGEAFRENRLRRGEALPWGGLLLLGSIPANDYVVRATPCEGEPMDLPLTVGATVRYPALRFGESPREEFTLDIVNPAENEATLCTVEYEPRYGGGGATRLTLDPPLAPGGHDEIGPLAADYYEFRLAGCEGGGYGLSVAIGEGHASEWRLGSEPAHTLQTR